MPAIAPEALLRHHDFVAALARTLLDDAAADDVVQETYRTALERPPRDEGAARSWLATVARNFARQWMRGEARRAVREVAASRPEAGPSLEDVAAREAHRKRVVDAVCALEEPYRASVLLRYYEDLPPRDIAARLGVPVETVRTRLKRGLEKLRASLDAEFGGDGTSWALAMAPIAAHRVVSSAIGAKAIVASAALAAATLLGASVLWATASSPSSAPPRAGAPEHGALQPGATALVVARAEAIAAAPGERRADPPQAPPTQDPAAASEPVKRANAIRGRVLDAQGSPVSHSWVYAKRLDLGRAGTDRSGSCTTDEAGRFILTPLLDVGYRVAAHDPKGGRAASVAWASVEPIRTDGDEIELVLSEARRPSAFVSGTIVGVDGVPLGQAEVGFWETVLLDGGWTPSEEGTGRFRMGPLVPGDYVLCVNPDRNAAPPNVPRKTSEGTEPPYRYMPFTLAAGQELDLGAVKLLWPGYVTATIRRDDGAKLDDLVTTFTFLDAPNMPLPTLDLGDVPPRKGPAVETRQWQAVPGRCVVAVAGDGFLPARAEVDVRAEGKTHVDLTLRAGGARCRIRVEYSPDAARDSREVRFLLTEPSGASVLDGFLQPRWPKAPLKPFERTLTLAAGTYRIDIASSCGAHGLADFTLTEGAAAPVVVNVKVR